MLLKVKPFRFPKFFKKIQRFQKSDSLILWKNLSFWKFDNPTFNKNFNKPCSQRPNPISSVIQRVAFQVVTFWQYFAHEICQHFLRWIERWHAKSHAIRSAQRENDDRNQRILRWHLWRHSEKLWISWEKESLAF